MSSCFTPRGHGLVTRWRRHAEMHMELRTYRAPTLAEAVTKLKADLGHNALILHTRQIVERYCFGLRKREIVEIVAGRNLARRTHPAAVAAAAAAKAPARSSGAAGYARPHALPL